MSDTFLHLFYKTLNFCRYKKHFYAGYTIKLICERLQLLFGEEWTKYVVVNVTNGLQMIKSDEDKHEKIKDLGDILYGPCTIELVPKVSKNSENYDYIMNHLVNVQNYALYYSSTSMSHNIHSEEPEESLHKVLSNIVKRSDYDETCQELTDSMLSNSKNNIKKILTKFTLYQDGTEYKNTAPVKISINEKNDIIGTVSLVSALSQHDEWIKKFFPVCHIIVKTDKMLVHELPIHHESFMANNKKNIPVNIQYYIPPWSYLLDEYKKAKDNAKEKISTTQIRFTYSDYVDIIDNLQQWRKKYM